MLRKGKKKKALCCCIDVSCTCMLNTECILAFSYKDIEVKKKVQRLSKAQKDLLPTKRLMEKDSSASGRKKRLEECDGESERGELLAAVCDTGIQLNDILKAQKQRKKCNV